MAARCRTINRKMTGALTALTLAAVGVALSSRPAPSQDADATAALFERYVEADSALYLKAPDRGLTLILLGNSGGLSEAFQ